MTDETAWQEPEIRCEWGWLVADRCTRSADHLLTFASGDPKRGFCDAHTREIEGYDPAPTRVEPILRDPRIASLLCGAFASAWDARLRALLDAGDPSVLLDCVEERALHEPPVERAGVLVGPWLVDERGDPVRHQEWLEVTGRHEHTWLPWRSGDKERATSACMTPGDVDWIRRCPCGAFEHEQPVARWCDGLRGDTPDRCEDPGCQREAGHPPPHRARYATGHGNIEEEEWDDEDTADHPRRTLIPAARHRLAESLARMTGIDAADITQRYLDGDPHVLD